MRAIFSEKNLYGVTGFLYRISIKLAELEKKLTGRLNVHERAIVHVLGEIRKLMASAEPSPEPQKRKIGFKVEEKAARYRVTRKRSVN